MSKPTWDTQEPVVVLMNKDGKSIGKIYPMLTEADRAAHAVTCGGHCCASWNWGTVKDNPRSFGCFSEEAGTRMFSVKDMDGWARSIIVTFTVEKCPAAGTYEGGKQEYGARVLGDEELVACHWDGSYPGYHAGGEDYAPQSAVAELIEAARNWWDALPEAKE